MQITAALPIPAHHAAGQTPADQVAESLSWLTEPGMTGQYVSSVSAIGDDAVRITVQDPDAGSPDAYPDEWQAAQQHIADNAASVLRQTLDGVRLIATTADGSEGIPGYFSADEQFFASNIPGVTSQAGEVWLDRNGDGIEDPDELVWLFPVSSEQAAERIGRIVRDEINERPVDFEIYDYQV